MGSYFDPAHKYICHLYARGYTWSSQARGTGYGDLFHLYTHPDRDINLDLNAKEMRSGADEELYERC